MHACVRWTKAQGLTAALESFLSLGSSVLCWFAPGWSHLRTHLSQQLSVSCASIHPSSTGPRGRACSASLPTLHIALLTTPIPTESGLGKHSAGMLTMGRASLLCSSLLSQLQVSQCLHG